MPSNAPIALLLRSLLPALGRLRAPAFALLVCTAGLALLLEPAAAHADTISTFALDGSGSQTLSGSDLEVTLGDIQIGGVTFDAVLSVTGSGDLTQSSSGLGVSGGSSLINAGESLRFTLAVESVSGGTIVFLGFDSLDFTFFTTEGEEAVLSLDDDLDSACDNFLTAYAPDDDPFSLSGARPTAFSLFGVDGFGDGGGSVSFRIDSIDAAFSATSSVPEPGSLLLVLAGCVVGAWRRRIRQRRVPR